MRLAVVGAGRWGKNHIRTLSGMGVLGAIIEFNDEARADLQTQYPNVKTFKTLADHGALDYDAYSVVVPAELHFSVTKTLLENNKHVLVEKPITLTSSEAIELVSIAKKRQLILTTGHLLLFHPAFRKMKSLIDSGKIGKIQYIYSNRLNLGTVRTEENSLWSFAPHDISLFQFLTGGFPNKVTCSGGAFLQPHIHDTTLSVLEYPDNVVGHIFVSWLHPFKEHRFIVIGSKGMLSFEDSSQDKKLYYYEKGIDFVNGEPVKRDGPTENIQYESSAPLEEELKHFISCIENKKDSDLISGEKGVEVLQILEMAEHELKKNEPLSSSSQQTSQSEPSRQASQSEEKAYFSHETATIDSTASIEKGTKIWNFSNIQKNAQIGEGSILGQNVNVGPNVSIGKKCKIQNNVSVYEGVELEDYVFCGPSMVFTNIMIPRSKYPQADSKYYAKTLVKEGASIGANATIVCGNTIGKYALIGAGAVVRKDVPDYAIIVGNPGRQVGWISEAGTKLDFSESNEVQCPKSQCWYRLENNRVEDITSKKKTLVTEGS